MRTNRTLLSLNLAQNTIGDVGAKALADVISRFPLTFAEIVYRRYIMSGRSFEKSVSLIIKYSRNKFFFSNKFMYDRRRRLVEERTTLKRGLLVKRAMLM